MRIQIFSYFKLGSEDTFASLAVAWHPFALHLIALYAFDLLVASKVPARALNDYLVHIASLTLHDQVRYSAKICINTKGRRPTTSPLDMRINMLAQHIANIIHGNIVVLGIDSHATATKEDSTIAHQVTSLTDWAQYTSRVLQMRSIICTRLYRICCII